MVVFFNPDLRDEGMILGENFKYKADAPCRGLSESVLGFLVAPPACLRQAPKARTALRAQSGPKWEKIWWRGS